MKLAQIAELAYNAGLSLLDPKSKPFSKLTAVEQAKIVSRARFHAKGLGTTAREAYDFRTQNAIAEPLPDGDPADAALRAKRAAERAPFDRLPENEQVARAIFTGVVKELLPKLTEQV